MSDIGVSLNENPDGASEYPSATAIGNPPISLTGTITDFANRTLPATNSLGLLMDGQGVEGADTKSKPLGPLPSYSVIDATGAGDHDPGDGYAKAIPCRLPWRRVWPEGLPICEMGHLWLTRLSATACEQDWYWGQAQSRLQARWPAGRRTSISPTGRRWGMPITSRSPTRMEGHCCFRKCCAKRKAKYNDHMVIARFDRVLASCFLFLLFAFAAAGVVAANAIGWKDVGAWACAFFVLSVVLCAFVVLRQFVFDGRAVWIENEKLCFLEADANFRAFDLYYLLAYVRRIPLDSIAEVTPEPESSPAGSTRRRGVFVRVKSGSSFKVLTFLLSDSPEAVLTRLREALEFAPTAHSFNS